MMSALCHFRTLVPCENVARGNPRARVRRKVWLGSIHVTAATSVQTDRSSQVALGDYREVPYPLELARQLDLGSGGHVDILSASSFSSCFERGIPFLLAAVGRV